MPDATARMPDVATRERVYGKYRGVVLNTTDPLNLGRIQASVGEVLGEVPTGWATPCAPYAGTGAGFFSVPPVGAGVWIEFEGGDVSFPIWVGCYWHDNEVPARVAAKVKVIRTPGKAQIVIDDDNHTIEIEDDAKNNVMIDKNGIAFVRKSKKVAITESKVSVNDGSMEVT